MAVTQEWIYGVVHQLAFLTDVMSLKYTIYFTIFADVV